ncbi:MAG: YkgJ family cysteine cluster protein [Deltaproteobacteria bacterium]|nr:YkgJ family cysteine cluster protein [Deltaproteobacteria bacterium]MBW2172782.1 YkgJ family cysteine cluster protein [Deltaproteobacteria bacterium]MBW2260243.1 YkgJ family cysteine cluster protein [Deltaproteobacteria bacterium]
MWHERIQDFGEEVQPDSTFRFECHGSLSCFGKCCNAEITLTPYDIARMRRHLGIDTAAFLPGYCNTYTDRRTGFPFVTLKQGEDDGCIFLGRDGCSLYENRPSCCRNYPLARVIDEDWKSANRVVRYHLQQQTTYCEGFGRGPDLTVDSYVEMNGLGPYEKANDVFLDVPFTFNSLPKHLKQDRDVQSMVFDAVFNFDGFFEKYGHFPHTAVPDDDGELIVLIRNIVLNLIMKTGELNPDPHS